MAAAGIRGTFRGTMVHAHWQPYFPSTTCDHALCHAHHLRERRCIATQSPQTWANDMAALLGGSNAAVAATPAPAMSGSPPALLAPGPRYATTGHAGFAPNP